MVTLRRRALLTPWDFDTPDIVDLRLAQIEKELLLHAWDEGWLPARITWDMWVERPVNGWEYLPVVEASMTATERRS